MCMLVILEGLDNTGKTTIAKMLMQYYKIQGKNAILAKELSTPVGEQIKQLSREGKLTPELKSYLFPADRRLLLDGLGKIKKDDIVIFDRYVPSAIAYRMADGIDKEWVQGINKNFPRHDLGFYIDITPDESIRRNTDQKFNIRYSYDHLDRVRKAYKSILDEYSLEQIDGTQSINNIFKHIASKVNNKIKEKEDIER